MSEKLAAVTRFFASRPAMIITSAIIGGSSGIVVELQEWR